MKRLFVSAVLTSFIVFSLVIATARPAWGYVDPGSGFIAVQAIASAAAAFGYFLRRRIRNIFTSDKKEEAILVPNGLQKNEHGRAK